MGFKSLGEVLLAGVPMYISDQQPAREPDLLIVLNANRQRIKANYLAGPADLVVEIVVTP
jgi:Uma2 family endonuclease